MHAYDKVVQFHPEEIRQDMRLQKLAGEENIPSPFSRTKDSSVVLQEKYTSYIVRAEENGNDKRGSVGMNGVFVVQTLETTLCYSGALSLHKHIGDLRVPVDADGGT